MPYYLTVSDADGNLIERFNLDEYDTSKSFARSSIFADINRAIANDRKATAWPTTEDGDVIACPSCGSTCTYCTSFCNCGHCLHCGEATSPEHAECAPDPQMMAAEYNDDFDRSNYSKYTHCSKCHEELELS